MIVGAEKVGEKVKESGVKCAPLSVASGFPYLSPTELVVSVPCDAPVEAKTLDG